MIAIGVILHHLHRFDLFNTRLLCYFVFSFICVVFEVPDIGNVSDIAYFVVQVAEIAEQQIKCNGRPGMPQVWITLYGGDTNVKAYVGRLYGVELFFFSRKRVIKRQIVLHDSSRLRVRYRNFSDG
jgi:hypothetical protein